MTDTFHPSDQTVERYCAQVHANLGMARWLLWGVGGLTKPPQAQRDLTTVVENALSSVVFNIMRTQGSSVVGRSLRLTPSTLERIFFSMVARVPGLQRAQSLVVATDLMQDLHHMARAVPRLRVGSFWIKLDGQEMVGVFDSSLLAADRSTLWDESF